MITRITFDKRDAAQVGIRTEVMRDLGPLVVLAGPNGHGKSRHLDLVEAAVKHIKPTASELTSLRDRNMNRYNIEQLEAALGEVLEDSTGGESLDSVVLRYRPELVPLDPDLAAGDKARDLITHADGGSYAAVVEGMHVHLANIAAALSHGTHPHNANDADIQKAHEAAKRFNELLDGLLSAQVTPRPSTANRYFDPVLFGRRFNHRELSAGQRILIAWAILIHRQLGHYRGKIVLIDEPEVYMHPDVCLRAIDRLRGLLGPHGQVWVATHSLPLIARADPESLYYVEDGLAQHAGSRPSRIWQSLLGGEHGAEHLLTFIGGDQVAALVRFCAESLIAPTSVDGASDDPQSEQVTGLIGSRLANHERTCVLDVGTGRGRIAAAMARSLAGNDRARTLRYTAFNDARFVTDKETELAPRAVEALARAGASAHYVTDLTVTRDAPADHADVVLLCNFLHEVPASNWMKLFEDICSCSKPEATLLVVEDQQPRIGELPHPRGFLILEENEWKALVGDVVHARRDRHGGRDLTAFAMPISALANVTEKSLRQAVAMVARRSLDQIRALRVGAEDDPRAGRRHAFYAMLHVNASLALEHDAGP